MEYEENKVCNFAIRKVKDDLGWTEKKYIKLGNQVIKVEIWLELRVINRFSWQRQKSRGHI